MIIDEVLEKLQGEDVEELRISLRENIEKKSQKGAERKVAPFEAAFIREELRRRKYHGMAWDRLRIKFMGLFELSNEQVNAVKAWESVSLSSKGGQTVAELIAKIRSQIEGKSSPLDPIDPKVGEPIADEPVLEVNYEDLENLYANFSEQDLVHIKSLEPTAFFIGSQGINREQRRWIYALILLSPEIQKKELRQYLAEKVFHCKLVRISSITAYLSEGFRERVNQEIIEDIELTTGYIQKKSTAEELEPTLELLDAANKGPEHTDFDTEIKRAWRGKLREFLIEAFPAEEMKNLRLLCLPGKKCLEIPMYLELGFRPENIIGVIRNDDKEAVREFRQNVEQLGINYKIGDLEDILLAEKVPLDVVILDFFGQLCSKYEKIIRKILPRKKMAILLNTMAKREGGDVQGVYQFKASMVGRNEGHLSKYLHSYDDLKQKDLSSVRNTGAQTLIEQVGKERYQTRPHYKRMCKMAKILDLDPDNNTFEWVKAVCATDFTRRLKNYLVKGGALKMRVNDMFDFAQVVASNAFCDQMFPSKYKKYEYQNESKTNYQSDFALIHAQEDNFERCPEIIDFYFRCLTAIIQDTKLDIGEKYSNGFVRSIIDIDRSNYFKLLDNRDNEIDKIDFERQKKIRIAFYRADKTMIASIKLNRIAYELREYAQKFSGEIPIDQAGILQIPREKILVQ